MTTQIEEKKKKNICIEFKIIDNWYLDNYTMNYSQGGSVTGMAVYTFVGQDSLSDKWYLDDNLIKFIKEYVYLNYIKKSVPETYISNPSYNNYKISHDIVIYSGRIIEDIKLLGNHRGYLFNVYLG